MSEPTDDRKLLLAYHRDGSHEAFGQLVGKYSPMVFQTALRRTRDHQLAEDVTQAVFIVLARRAGSLRSHESIAGWLHQTAIFASSSALRAQARQRKHESAAAKSEAIALPPPDESSELTARIEDELHRLPTIHRNVLVLHYLEGKTIPQTAELLGVSHETARKRLSRALERLRGKLARRGSAIETSSIILAAGTISAAAAGANAEQFASKAAAGGENGNAFSLASDLIRMFRVSLLRKVAVGLVAAGLCATGVIGATIAQRGAAPRLSTTPTTVATQPAFEVIPRDKQREVLQMLADLREHAFKSNTSGRGTAQLEYRDIGAGAGANRAKSVPKHEVKFVFAGSDSLVTGNDRYNSDATLRKSQVETRYFAGRPGSTAPVSVHIERMGESVLGDPEVSGWAFIDIAKLPTRLIGRLDEATFFKLAGDSARLVVAKLGSTLRITVVLMPGDGAAQEPSTTFCDFDLSLSGMLTHARHEGALVRGNQRLRLVEELKIGWIQTETHVLPTLRSAEFSLAENEGIVEGSRSVIEFVKFSIEQIDTAAELSMDKMNILPGTRIVDRFTGLDRVFPGK